MTCLHGKTLGVQIIVATTVCLIGELYGAHVVYQRLLGLAMNDKECLRRGLCVLRVRHMKK